MKNPCLLGVFLVSLVLGAAAAEVSVTNAAELRSAVSAARPGTRVLLAGGTYAGGFLFANLRGEPDRPIVLAAADAKNPPVFSDAKTGLQLSNPAWVELRDLAFTRLSDNGLNIDDGAPSSTEPGEKRAHHITLHGLRVSDVGTTGNQDGIKLSGLWDFRVEACTIERWGRGGGSAIDLVGCHRGEITGNTIRHEVPEPGNCTGVQAKGGSAEIAITRNRFEHAGGRAINIGGSTGRPFFRPPLAGPGPHYEAQAIRVEGNTFAGGVAPMAFVGVDGAVVRFNTIENPGRWALRILQENRAADFIASRGGVFSDNVIIFESARWFEGGVNIGAGTSPETFSFARNWWFCRDRPDRSTPRLPTTEVDGVYGRDPAGAKAKAGAAAWRPGMK